MKVDHKAEHRTLRPDRPPRKGEDGRPNVTRCPTSHACEVGHLCFTTSPQTQGFRRASHTRFPENPMVLPVLKPTTPSVVLYADGGTLGGSPGCDGVYWSVGSPDGPSYRQVDRSGRHRRSEEAEFLAFVEALEHLRDSCSRGDTGLVLTDCTSVLVHFKDLREPKKNRRLREIYERGLRLMTELRFLGVNVQIGWTPRDEMVSVLGH